MTRTNALREAKNPATIIKPTTKLRLRNSDGAITGCSLCRSETTNRASRTTAAAIMT